MYNTVLPNHGEITWISDRRSGVASDIAGEGKV